jgi:hypothetical protein
MTRHIAVSLVLLLVAAGAFAHAGHIHSYMGEVTMLHSDGSFMMKATDGTDVTVLTSTETKYQLADGRDAARSDLAEGTRVVVKMSKDGKTAATIKLAK